MWGVGQYGQTSANGDAAAVPVHGQHVQRDRDARSCVCRRCIKPWSDNSSCCGGFQHRTDGCERERTQNTPLASHLRFTHNNRRQLRPRVDGLYKPHRKVWTRGRSDGYCCQGCLRCHHPEGIGPQTDGGIRCNAGPCNGFHWINDAHWDGRFSLCQELWCYRYNR